MPAPSASCASQAAVRNRPMSALGQKRTFSEVCVMSALGQKRT
jgi:hypothetical protein